MKTHMHYDAADVVATTAIAITAAGAGNALREDAPIWFARQLDYVRARIYETQRPAMRAFDLVPVSTEIPVWAETATQRSYDQVGMAKIIANYADDLPRADVSAKETTIKVRDVGDSYGYNISEMRASEAFGTQLPTKKAAAARFAVDVKMNQIAMVGDAAYGLYGLLNHPNIGLTAGLNGDWLNVATTAADILEDMNTLVNAVRLQSLGIHNPNMFAMPLAQFARIQSTFVEDAGGRTILQVFQANNPGVEIVPVVELKDSGPGGQDVAIVAERNVENFAFELVMPFTQLPAQARNLELVVPCLARTAGLTVTYPLSVTKGYLTTS